VAKFPQELLAGEFLFSSQILALTSISQIDGTLSEANHIPELLLHKCGTLHPTFSEHQALFS
jgi:hypothetical protein